MKKLLPIFISLLILLSGCFSPFGSPSETDGGLVAGTSAQTNLTPPVLSSESDIPTPADSSILVSPTTGSNNTIGDMPTTTLPPDPQDPPTTVPPTFTPVPTDYAQNSCTISITCASILDNMGKFNTNKLSVLPADGIILPETRFEPIYGETVFDALKRITRENKIHMEFMVTPFYGSSYIEGINNLYEFDCGELSGWMYRVNGKFPDVGCGSYKLESADIIEWIYTCDLGRDIGGGEAFSAQTGGTDAKE